MERGPVFNKQEYMDALELLAKSDLNFTSEMLVREKAKLDKIMKQVGVTV